MKTTVLLSLFISLAILHPLRAQTCGCGGAPLLGSLLVAPTPSGEWELGWRYEHNEISDLVIGSRRLEPDSRRQRTRTVLMEASYGLSSSLSFTTLFTLIDKERISGDRLRVRGIGDAVALVKYRLLKSTVFPRREVSIGAGLKAPLGKSSLTTAGTLIAADMQPGSGAWDEIVWAFISSELPTIAPSSIFLSTSHRSTGTNRRYGASKEGYTFGPETVATLGLSRALGNRFGATLSLHYRATRPDQFGFSDVPNTGGTWVDLKPGFNVNFSSGITARFAAQIPVYRNLHGALQLTTRFAASASIYYSFGKSSSLFNERN